jgi:hypothetical protein
MLPNFEEMCNIFIRPQRHRYKVSDLGSKNFELSGLRVYREDFQLKNCNGLSLECSVYSTHSNMRDIRKTILYLHCNSGCRLEGKFSVT